jgi:hypothetical protein
MSHFSEETLRAQMQGTVPSGFVVQTIHHMSQRHDRSGHAIHPLDNLRAIYLGRLSHTQHLQPSRPDLVQLCQSVLAALDSISIHDDLYSWHIAYDRKHLTGLSTPTRVVFSIPYDDSSESAVA